MKAMEEFFEYFRGLSAEEQKDWIGKLMRLMQQERGREEVREGEKEGKERRGMKCPHCGGVRVNGYGRIKGKQRYLCRGCRRTFMEDYGCVTWRVKKREKFEAYMVHMFMGKGIVACAKEVGVSVQTSFNWRHKILKALEVVKPESLRGVVEMDEMYFLHSEKGNRHLGREPRRRGGRASKAGIHDEHVAVVVGVSRSGGKDMEVVGRGRMSTEKLEKALSEKLKSAEILCTDSHRTYASFARRHNIAHKVVRSQKGQRITEGIYHVQRVNQVASDLRTWMRRFRGVSTKWLQNYLNWYLAIKALQHDEHKLVGFVAFALSSTLAWHKWRMMI